MNSFDNDSSLTTNDKQPIWRRPKQACEIKTLEDIIGDLRYLTEGFPTAAIRAAIKRQEEITPLLIKLLKRVIDHHASLERGEFGHLYAMFLLAQFREKLAFPLVLKLASLPNDTPDFLLGDIITENLHNIIASLYHGGDFVSIQKFIENQEVYSWCRSAGIRSLLTLVKEKVMPRNNVIEYFKQLFSHKSIVSDGMALSHLISASCDLYAKELKTEIEEACDSNLIDPFMAEPEWTKKLFSQESVSTKGDLLTEVARHYGFVNDAIDSMGWWCCFKKPSPTKKQIKNIKTPYHREFPKIGRNDSCPCGSGKKFKKCCLN